MAGFGPHADDQLPLSEPALTQVAARLAAIEQTLQDFQTLAMSLLTLAARAPLHVDHLEVERLEFKVDSVDVGELSGELNIGLTSRFNLGQNGTAGEARRPEESTVAKSEGPTPAPPPPTSPIWPPPTAAPGGDDGDSFGPVSGAGSQEP